MEFRGIANEMYLNKVTKHRKFISKIGSETHHKE